MPILYNWPKRNEVLYGRDDLLSKLVKQTNDSITQQNTTICLLYGMPAVGKTVLAIELANCINQDLFDGKILIDCYGYTPGHTPLTIEKILDCLFLALHIPSKTIPQNYDEKIAMWSSITESKSLIIVLDNIISVKQVKDLLTNNGKSVFIITSRRRNYINNSLYVQVMPIEEEPSVELLNNGELPTETSKQELLKKLAKKYNYLPYALKVLSYQIKGRGNDYIKRILQRPTINNLEVDTNSLYIQLDLSFKRLNKNEKKALYVSSIFPGYDISPNVYSVMMNIDETIVSTTIDSLYEQSLIKEVGDDRYIIHDIVRDFILKQYSRIDYSPIKRLFDYYITTIKYCNALLYPFDFSDETSIQTTNINYNTFPENSVLAHKWYKIEIENILACLDFANRKNWMILYFNLSSVLFQYITKSLSNWRVIEIYKILSNFKDLDDIMKAKSYNKLACSYHQIGDFKKAEEYFILAEDIFEKNKKTSNLSDVLINHSFTLERLGLYNDSLTILERALSIEKTQGNLVNIARIYNNQGAVYWRIKDYYTAKKKFIKAIMMRKTVGDELGKASSFNNLAFTMLKLGNAESAIKGFEKSLSLAKQSLDYSSEAVTLNNLGYTYIYLNNPEKAIKYANLAYEKADIVGNEYQFARSYDVKGQAYILLKDNKKAKKHLQMALKLFDKLNVPEKHDVKEIIKSIKIQ